MSRRAEIEMSADERRAFLTQERTVICATNGLGGWPHLMPLWYVVREGDIWAWTYGRSQKVRNLERDARATLQVEAGESYDQLRGVMIQARTTIHRDSETVAALGTELLHRYGDGAPATPQAAEQVRRQAGKRVALRFVADDVASWDHRKLGESC
jgi:nitroimidazol reductase NimA-like FMN-containing flavoprotein (pyridoxamine 5'-phosphate oxidase superfamily)